MVTTTILTSLLGLASLASAAQRPPPNNRCRNIPGDAGWPSAREWKQLNATVGGKLIATVPVGHVCHDSGVVHAYDEQKCWAVSQGILHEGAPTL